MEQREREMTSRDIDLCVQCTHSPCPAQLSKHMSKAGPPNIQRQGRTEPGAAFGET